MKKYSIKASAIILSLIAMSGILCGCEDNKPFDKTKEINVISRESGSGTRDAFTELTGVLVRYDNGDKKDFTSKSAVTINSTEAVITNVSSDKYAVGYISSGSLRNTVKPLKINGKVCNSENINDGSYPVARPFILAYKNEINDEAKDFLDYILSNDGQKIIEKQGYVSVSDKGKYKNKKISGKISIAGSSSVSPIVEKLKESYEKINPDVKIEIQTTDSSAGITGAMEGTCDIAMSSRNLKDKETQLTSTVIAKDGIAVIVNKKNTTNNISSKTLKEIYTGKISKWSQVAK